MNDPANTIIAILAEVGDTLSRAITVPHSPYQRAMRAAMDAPQVGDLVLITMTRRGQAPGSRVGRYLGRTHVVLAEGCEANDWEELEEPAHVIVTADGTVMNWTNCGIVRLSGLEDATHKALDATRTP